MGATFDSPERKSEARRGPMGPPGARGPGVLGGRTGAPSVFVGQLGDYYVDMMNRRIWGPREEAGWVAWVPFGEPGPQGPKGDQGLQGMQGIQGIQGPRGFTGETGTKGDTGAQGIQGIQGIQGLKGDKGDQGLKGDTGEQGLKGDTGDQGEQGPQGERGLQGLKGDRGDAFQVNAQGPLADRAQYDNIAMPFAFLDTDAGELYFRMGASGWSPPIPFGKGEKGDPGEQGLQGIQGIQGVKGDTGAQGVKGDKGDPGIQGPKGDQGIEGPQGLQGPPGEDGADGTDATVTEQAVLGALGYTPASLVNGTVPADELPDPPVVPTVATATQIRAGTDSTHFITVDASIDALGEVALVDAATVAINLALGERFTLLTTAGVGASRVLGLPTNLADKIGTTFTLAVTTDAASRVLAFATGYKFPGGTPPSISTGAGALDELVFYVKGAALVQFRGIAKDIK